MTNSPIHRSGLEYRDRVVLITGGARGIGAGCVRVFADAGARVMIADRDLTGAPTGIAAVVCDVSQPDQIRAAIDQTVAQFGRLDCLLNNAGIHTPPRPIDDVPLADVEREWQTNFRSVFVASQHALPHLRKTKGSILNIGSLVAQIGELGSTSYAASKGAISSFTKALALEETRHGVRVNCVLPGNIHSDSRARAAARQPDPAAFERELDSHQPSGRSGTPEEVGQLCLFLASDAASYITGIEIIISSGSELGYGVKFPWKLA